MYNAKRLTISLNYSTDLNGCQPPFRDAKHPGKVAGTLEDKAAEFFLGVGVFCVDHGVGDIAMPQGHLD
jgi:hypothetical protein